MKILLSDVLVVTTPTIPNGKIVRIIGPVYGMTIRSRGVGGKFVTNIQSIFGGEITSYVSELENARRESLQRLVENAKNIGANAVLSADFETSDILQSTAIVFSTYGTAVIIEAIELKDVMKGSCQSCGADNSPDARFCNKCGTTLQ